MSAVHGLTVDNLAMWSDYAWWDEHINLAISAPNPALANLRITCAHYRLSLALRQLLGSDTGANFHTWATWGSKKAGTTIRQEDVPHIRALAFLAGGSLGALSSAELRQRVPQARPLLGAAGTLLGSWAAHALTQQLLDHASRMILAGNILVLDDIGRQTARFVCTFHAHLDPDPQCLDGFLAGLRPGPTQAGGQSLLTQAFTHYYQAWHARDLNEQHEQMLLANLYAILHEHIRLQPYIASAMPLVARRLITHRLLHFSVGPRTMNVGNDVVPLTGVTCPCTLQQLENTELLAFLDGPQGWDRTPDSLLGSHATNWADIRDRLNFICDLFRTYHFDPSLFTAPYRDRQLEIIATGHIPRGKL